MQEIETILAVGSIAIDTIQTPNGSRDSVLGGSATYFSLAAAMFAPVSLVGVVGNDYPESGWRLFKSRNILTDNVQIMDGKTFRWGCKYNHDFSSRKTTFTELGVFESFSPSIRDENCQFPLVFLGNIQPDLQLDVARLITSAECIVSDTMNLWIDMCPEKVAEVLAISNVFLLNHEESFQFTGKKDVPDAACELLAAGPDLVIIKMGAEGSYLAFNDSAFYVPVFPIKKVIDPTGAGDSFAGGFMGCMAQLDKPDFVEAVIAGSAVASFCVENFGPDGLLNVTKEGIDRRIAVIRDRMCALERV